MRWWRLWVWAFCSAMARGFGGKVEGGDAGLGEVMGEGDGDGSGAGADVGDAEGVADPLIAVRLR